MRKRLINLPKQAFKAILTNKGRSFLTVLGIIIGIASVIALVSLGNAVKAELTGQFSKLGTSTLTVMPGVGLSTRGVEHMKEGSQQRLGGRPGGPMGGGVSSSLTFDDLNLLKTRDHPKMKAVSGNISKSVILEKNNKDRRYTVAGVSPSYFKINNLTAGKGLLFKSGDESKRSQSLVLGSDMARELYGRDNPVGKTLTVEDKDFEVVGVLNRAEESSFSDFNAQAFIPNTTAADIFEEKKLSSIAVQAKSDGAVDQLKADVEKMLLANHKIDDKKLADFSIATAKDLLSTIYEVTNILTMFLTGIAAISLVVGGIGIMNIMLVSVTERTREIGLRKAVGARTFDIVSQFLVEAVILTLLGGLAGIGLGALGAKGVAGHMLGISAEITTGTVLLAVGVSSLIGIVFGLYPAVKASRLNPIDALRYE